MDKCFVYWSQLLPTLLLPTFHPLLISYLLTGLNFFPTLFDRCPTFLSSLFPTFLPPWITFLLTVILYLFDCWDQSTIHFHLLPHFDSMDELFVDWSPTFFPSLFPTFQPPRVSYLLTGLQPFSPLCSQPFNPHGLVICWLVSTPQTDFCLFHKTYFLAAI